MADIVARCVAREVRTPTQYLARWTEVAVVARERGHLGQAELSFDGAADVDAARLALEDAVCGAITAEEGRGEEPARERTREMVGSWAGRSRSAAAAVAGPLKRKPWEEEAVGHPRGAVAD